MKEKEFKEEIENLEAQGYIFKGFIFASPGAIYCWECPGCKDNSLAVTDCREFYREMFPDFPMFQPSNTPMFPFQTEDTNVERVR